MEEVLKIKFINILKSLILIFIMTSPIHINLMSNSTRCMKPSSLEPLPRELQLNPLRTLKIKRPHVFQINLSFPSYDYHIIPHNSCWVVSPRFRTSPLDLHLTDPPLLQIEPEHVIELLLARASSPKDVDIVCMQHSRVIRPLEITCKSAGGMESNLFEGVGLNAVSPEVA